MKHVTAGVTRSYLSRVRDVFFISSIYFVLLLLLVSVENNTNVYITSTAIYYSILSVRLCV